MKSIFNPGNYPDNANLALLILRIGVGVLMLTHGLGKFNKLTGDAPITFGDPLGVGAETSLVLTVFAEVFCSILLIIGFATRLAAIPLLITFLVIVFIVHGADPLGDKELPIVYLIIYLVLAIVGAGRYSIDNLIYYRNK